MEKPGEIKVKSGVNFLVLTNVPCLHKMLTSEKTECRVYGKTQCPSCLFCNSKLTPKLKLFLKTLFYIFFVFCLGFFGSVVIISVYL